MQVGLPDKLMEKNGPIMIPCNSFVIPVYLRSRFSIFIYMILLNNRILFIYIIYSTVSNVQTAEREQIPSTSASINDENNDTRSIQSGTTTFM